MVEQIFLSPDVKQIVIISNKLELPQDLESEENREHQELLKTL